MGDEYTYSQIDELQLSALIADTIASDGTFTKPEIYGMMCLLMHLRDVKKKHNAQVSMQIVDTKSDDVLHTQHITRSYKEEDEHLKNRRPLARMKADVALQVRILDILKQRAENTRTISDILGYDRNDRRNRQALGTLMRWMVDRGDVATAPSNYKRNSLWCLPKKES